MMATTYRNPLLFLAGYVALVALSVSASFSDQTPPSTSSPASSVAVANGFDWEAVTPTKHLKYHDCYNDFKCARLQVPLDWLNETDPRTIAIAIIKLPAVVPDNHPAFAGAVFTNPGGPGGSGVAFSLNFAPHFRSIIDKPGKRHYEILSFDPRGIGFTTPRSDCFHHDMLARDADALEARGNGPLDRSRESVIYGLALARNFGRRCKDTEDQWGEVMPYVGTPSVARDMVEMIDKIEELRSRETERRKKEDGNSAKGVDGEEEEQRLELKKRTTDRNKDDVPRLQYIGFSYGTVLGNYFASIFPGRVGRVVLDGVCNTDDYATGPGWLTNTVDTDQIFENFIAGCYDAGPDGCDLVHFGDNSAEDIKTRFWAWINELNETPQAVIEPNSGSSVVVSGADVLAIIGQVLYSPITGFKPLATILEQALSGNVDYVAMVLVYGGVVPRLSDACPVSGNSSLLPEPQGIESQKAVLCGDGDDISNMDAAWWQDYVEKQTKLSSVFGAVWSTIRFTCSGWPFRTNWSFKGPFTTPKADSAGVKGRPAAPLLFLSNRLDPVTPLTAARAMAAKHPGAAVVVQEAMGHCAIPSAPSPCTRRILADYFDTGVVPSEETTCNATCGPWDQSCTIFDSEADSLIISPLSVPVKNHRLPLRRFPLGII